MSDRTIRELQSGLPWTGHYHRDFRATPMTHKDFAHALLHVHKAGGKLASILNDAEHGGVDWANLTVRGDVEKYVADMVICALRMATTCPEGQIDLQRAVENRLTAKNNQLASEAVAHRHSEQGKDDRSGLPWQPIQAAPRDGTKIWVRHTRGAPIYKAHWGVFANAGVWFSEKTLIILPHPREFAHLDAIKVPVEMRGDADG